MRLAKTQAGQMAYPGSVLVVSNNPDNDNPALRRAIGWVLSLRSMDY